jgi:hypothetical protein
VFLAGSRRQRPQGQQHAHLEGGVLRVRRRRGVPPGADVRHAHRGPRRRAPRPHQLLPGPRLLRGADRAAGGGAGSGARPHGHVHRTGHPLLEIQAGEDARTPGVVLVARQHPQSAASGGAGPPLGRTRLPVRQVRGVRQRRAGHDGAPDGGVARGPLQGHHHQSCQHRALLQGDTVLPGLQAAAAERPAAGAGAADGPHEGGGVLRQNRTLAAGQVVPQVGAESEQQGDQRGAQLAPDRGRGFPGEHGGTDGRGLIG